MKSNAASVYVGHDSKKPSAALQRVRKAVWNCLKRICHDKEETVEEEIFLTPPQSPRHLSVESSGSTFSSTNQKEARFLQMHDRIVDQVFWEPIALPCASEVVVRKCRWRQTTVCYPH